MKNYFVSYFYKNKDDSWGFGCTSFESNKKIKNIKNLESIMKDMELKYKCETVVILNYKEL